MTMQVIHKKTGNIYNVLYEARDATNDSDSGMYVVYCRADEPTAVFVRELIEFYAKFCIIH